MCPKPVLFRPSCIQLTCISIAVASTLQRVILQNLVTLSRNADLVLIESDIVLIESVLVLIESGLVLIETGLVLLESVLVVILSLSLLILS